MTESLILIVCGIAAACAIFLWRLRILEGNQIALRRFTEEQESRIAQLTSRVFQLEGGTLATATTVPVVVPEPEPVRNDLESPQQPQTEREDWETVVGTNWLNRAGALVLVVGIALFLGYSLTHLGAWGKITIGFATGLSMLTAGIALSSREQQYRNFSLSLIGGGWAVVYFTGYAMHGIDAARVIGNPFTGTLILLTISGAMLSHAMLYRSEAGVTLAYLLGFTSLNVNPLTSFSVVATLSLAVSMVVLSLRLFWLRLAIAGVLLTYVTFLLRYDATLYSQAGLRSGQITLWIYWLLFESADLIRAFKGSPSRPSLLLLNAFGFLAASVFHQSAMKMQDWTVFFAAGAFAYLVSALLRHRLKTEHWTGSYQPAAVLCAALMAAALISKFDGASMTFALMFEGELIVLVGLALKNRFLQNLGFAVLFLPFFRILLVHVPSSVPVRQWTPAAITLALLFAINRIVLRAGVLYSAPASLLVSVVLAAELESKWLTVALAAQASALLALGFAVRDRALRIGGLLLFVFCIVKLFLWDLRELDTLSRIFSFVILGLMLMGVSWIYARYREKIRKLL